MRRVVLDSNALMMPFQFGINLDAELARLLGECEAVVPLSIRKELARLSKTSSAAKGGMRLSEGYATFRTKAEGDESIIEAAKALKAAVVTNDSELLARLKEHGIARIRLKSRNHLVIEGE